MRDFDTIDSELRLLAAVRRSIREHGGEPSSRQVDELLDERLAHRGRPSKDVVLVGPVVVVRRRFRTEVGVGGHRLGLGELGAALADTRPRHTDLAGNLAV
jgi:hypothetical protein